MCINFKVRLNKIKIKAISYISINYLKINKMCLYGIYIYKVGEFWCKNGCAYKLLSTHCR